MICVPSGFNRGTSFCCGLETSISAEFSSIRCLKMSKTLVPPVLLERNRTDLLSTVQSKGRSSASFRVRRRGIDTCGPLAKYSATYTSSCTLHLLKASFLPSVVALGKSTKSSPLVIFRGGPEGRPVTKFTPMPQKFEVF